MAERRTYAYNDGLPYLLRLTTDSGQTIEEHVIGDAFFCEEAYASNYPPEPTPSTSVM